MLSDLNQVPWARRLKLRHLEMFIVLESAGGITAAAERLHMTQPAVSHWLADLEDVVGCPLFVRGRRLKLTVAGEVLRRHAQRMRGDVQRTGVELDAVRSGLAGRIHVGSILSATLVLLPRAIFRLQQEHAGVTVFLQEGTLESLLERLVKRELDLIIGPLDVRANMAGFASHPLMDDTVQVAARPDHPLVRKRKPRWEDAAQYPWVMPPPGSLTRTKIENAFAAQRVPTPKPRVETASIIAMQMLLRESDCLAALSGLVVEFYRSLGLVEPVRLAPEISFGTVGMLWTADSANTILTHMLDALKIESKAL